MVNGDGGALGVNFPIRRSNDGFFDQTFTTIEHTKANLVNVLSTRQGERIFRPEFGSRLDNLLFEPMSQQLEVDIEQEINRVVQTHLPYVEIENIKVSRADDRGLAVINLRFTTFFLPDNEKENVEIFFELSDQPS